MDLSIALIDGSIDREIRTRSESEMDQIDDLVLGFGRSACRGSKLLSTPQFEIPCAY